MEQHRPQEQKSELDQQIHANRLRDETQQPELISTAASYPTAELDASQASFATNPQGNPDAITKMAAPSDQGALSPSNPHQQPIELLEAGMEPTEAERKMDLLPERMYPMKRPTGVARISKYAPWSKKANKKWDLGYSDFPVLPTGATLKANKVTPLTALGEMPAPIDCPWCETKSETVVTKEMGSHSTLGVVGCCLCCGLIGALIPCFCDMCRDSRHFCSNCGMLVAHRDDGAATAQAFGPNQQLQTTSKYRAPSQMTASVPPPAYEQGKYTGASIMGPVQHSQEARGIQNGQLDTKRRPEAEQGPRYELQATPMENDAGDYFSQDAQARAVEDKERQQAEEMQREKGVSSTGEQPSPVSTPGDSEAAFGGRQKPEGSQAAISPVTK